MEIPGGWELVLVLLVIVVVFGSERRPDTARSRGRSMRILKAETRGLHDDDTPAGAAAPAPTAAPAPAHVTPVVLTFQGQPLFDALGRPVELPARPRTAARG